MSAVAAVLRLNGDLASAEKLLRQSLEMNLRLRGEDHPNTGASLHDLALVAATRGDYPAAESLFSQALSTYRKALGDRHPAVAANLNGLSRVLVARHRYAEAELALQEAVQIARVSLGGDHQSLALYASNLAAVHLARKDARAAEPLLREALRIRVLSPTLVPMRRRMFVEDDWTVGGIKSLLGAALLGMARYEEAEAMLLDARRDLDALRPPPRRDIDANLARLVQLYDAWGKRDKAAMYRAQLAS